MKTDKYTRFILTIIALCLAIIVLKDFDILPKAYAAEPSKISEVPVGYKIVPVNDVMDVRLVDINTWDQLNVNIKGVDTYDELKVNLKKIETNNSLNINVDKIGGGWISNGGPIPVQVQVH